MAVAAATDMYSSQEPPHHASPEGEGTDWGMLKILGGLFAARQRGVEDGAVNWSSNPGHRLRCLCRFLLHGYWRQVVVVAVEPDSVVSHEEASYILPGFFNCRVALIGHPL